MNRLLQIKLQVYFSELLGKGCNGENIDNETLGGATTHCEVSGVTDYKAKNDKDALDKIKRK